MFVVALLLAMPVSQAHAVQTFDVGVRNVKKDGRFTLSITSRSFDPSGGPGPVTKTVKMWFPRAAKISIKGFPKCDLKKLKDARDEKVCKDAIYGTGTAVVDVRPLFPDPITAKLTMFVGKSKKRNGVMSLIIMARPTSGGALVESSIQFFEAPIVRDNSLGPDYGYRMDLDASIETPPELQDLTISIAELKVKIPPKTRIKKTCKKKRRGKCVKYKKKKILLARLKKCPASKEILFRADFTFADGTFESIVSRAACRFKIRRK